MFFFNRHYDENYFLSIKISRREHIFFSPVNQDKSEINMRVGGDR